jgi:hypothetical protein
MTGSGIIRHSRSRAISPNLMAFSHARERTRISTAKIADCENYYVSIAYEL